MLLAIDAPAVAVFRFIQPALLSFGDVAVVLGFVDSLALGNVRVMSLVSGGLLPGHGAFRKALVNARLLIIKSLIHLILARVVRHWSGLRHRAHGDQRGTYEPSNVQPDVRFLHDSSQICYTRLAASAKDSSSSSLKKRQMLHKTFADPSR